MFNEPVTTSQFVGDTADSIFEKIHGVIYRGDYSMTSTLRALLAERIGEDEVFSYYTIIRYTEREGKAETGMSFANRIFGNSHYNAYPNRHSITFTSISTTEEVSAKLFAELDKTKFPHDFVPLEDVARYFGQSKITVRAFMNAEAKSTIVVVDNMTTKKWHAIQSMMPRFLPWYFTNNPLNETEVLLLKSLIHRYKPEYEKLLDAIAEKFDFRSLKIRSSLAGFEGLFLKKQLKNTRDEISSVMSEIDRLKNRIGDYFRQLDGLRTTEYGVVARMQEKADPEQSEIMHLFLKSKSLDLVTVEDSTVRFVAKSTVSNYDPDIFDRLIKNKKSAFFRHWENGRNYSDYLNKNFTDEDIERLLREIFEKNNMALRVCAAYQINFGRASVSALRGYDYEAKVLETHIPNQHIHQYACRGNYEYPMEEAARQYKYAEAISLCLASCSNMNMSEANTVSYFMEAMLAKDAGKCIQLSDGTCVTPLEAAKMLRPDEAPVVEEKHETEEA